MGGKGGMGGMVDGVFRLNRKRSSQRHKRRRRHLESADIPVKTISAPSSE